MTGHTILGDSPGGFRVGVLALANDQVIERDLGRLLPDDVWTFTTRIAYGGDCSLEQLAQMAPTLTDATRLLNPEVALDAVVFGCTSGTIAIGVDQIADAIHLASPKAAVVNPVQSACAAFERLNARRLNLITPYEPELAELMTRTFAAYGFEIVNRHDFGIVESADISRVTPQAIRQATAALPRNVDATFISCTDFQSLSVLADIERDTGLPTVTSNQAIVWRLLSLAGAKTNIQGFGRLLETFDQTADQQGELA
ncbi:Maleate isomerase [Falsiruegeria litorea R37]|uniref:Maleate isomerase n=1 Tax=Falsiruegeria litorea R37 TaxID=1200284 RepID=A0A1Y5TV07_9RHOB|nr:aspartate/glutamate racemase family protein [Falsiruegeria litorea]SLN73347.1 Maleate isomerase [Falsiruegeria litorea R37]